MRAVSLLRSLRPAAVISLLAAGSVLSVAHAGPKEDARRYFVTGLESAQAQDFEAALDAFLAAQAAYPHPATLYNIARTYEDLGNDDQALLYYRRFSEAAPDRASEVAPFVRAIQSRRVQSEAPAAVEGSGEAIVVAGSPSRTELARLEAIEAEIGALRRAWELRAEEPVEGVVKPAPSTEPREPTVVVLEPDGIDLGSEPDGAPQPGEPVASGDLLDQAYERVVVTASRYGQDPLDSPSSLTVITAEEIRMFGATTVPEVLRRVVGVESMSLAAGQSEISMRGFNRELSNKVLVLIDGRSTYYDFIGTTLWSTLPVAMEEIERIEVIRGPGSAIYGANSVTGVVNIITRTPGEGENVATFSAGQPGLRTGTALVTGRRDDTTYRLSAGFDRLGRWGKPWDAADHSAIEPFQPDPELSRQTVRLHGRLDHQLGEQGFLSLSGGYSDGIAEFYNLGALGDFIIDTATTTVRADAALGPVHLRAFWTGLDGETGPFDEAVGAPHSLDTPIDSDTVDVELEASHTLATGPVEHRLSGGAGYRYKRIADFAFLGLEPGGSAIDEHHVNAFVNEEAAIGPVRVVGSLRADKHPLIDISRTLSPRGAVIARVDDRRAVRVSGGTAFRIPTLVESYMDFTLPSGVDGVVIQDDGDQTLLPERILTAEVGYHDESTLFHTADVALYANRLTNVIGLTDVTPGISDLDPTTGAFTAGTTRWANQTDVVTSFGAEAQGELYPADGLDLFLNVHVQRILVDDEQGNRTFDESSSLAKVNGGVQYRTPWRIDLSADVSWASGQTWALREFDADGRLVQDVADIPYRLMASGRIAGRPLPGENVELALTGWNVFGLVDGQRVREHPKGQPVGGRLFGSVRVEF